MGPSMDHIIDILTFKACILASTNRRRVGQRKGPHGFPYQGYPWTFRGLLGRKPRLNYLLRTCLINLCECMRISAYRQVSVVDSSWSNLGEFKLAYSARSERAENTECLPRIDLENIKLLQPCNNIESLTSLHIKKFVWPFLPSTGNVLKDSIHSVQ